METDGLVCDVHKTEDAVAGRVITVTCRGRLISRTSDTLRETVKPLIVDGGKIIVDVGDVQFIDSMGLGALVGLKVSAIGTGYCTLTFVNLSKRVQELVSMTKLTDLLKS